MATLHKRPIQVYLRPDQLDKVRALARRRHLSIAEIIRQGVDRVLGDVPPEEDPLWELVGMVTEGPSDLSEKHDEYLTKWVLEDNH
jgi:Ribbon-helix-helix protein, copG family